MDGPTDIKPGYSPILTHQLEWYLNVIRVRNKYEWNWGRCCISTGRRCVCAHQMAALLSMKWRHGHHIENVTLNRKSASVNRCVFTSRTILQNYIPIRLETSELLFEDGRPRTTTWVAIWDQPLVQRHFSLRGWMQSVSLWIFKWG